MIVTIPSDLGPARDLSQARSAALRITWKTAAGPIATSVSPTRTVNSEVRKNAIGPKAGKQDLRDCGIEHCSLGGDTLYADQPQRETGGQSIDDDVDPARDR